MRLLIPLLLLLPNVLAAHPGHIADVAGHDHWVAGAAIGLAILVALWGALKGKKKGDVEAEEADAAEEDVA